MFGKKECNTLGDNRPCTLRRAEHEIAVMSRVVALFGLLAGAACGAASAAAPLPLPTGPQLNWQAMEIGAIGHFNMETFQYCGIGLGGVSGVQVPPPATFAPTQVDTDGWIAALASFNVSRAVLVVSHGCGYNTFPSATAFPGEHLCARSECVCMLCAHGCVFLCMRVRVRTNASVNAYAHACEHVHAIAEGSASHAGARTRRLRICLQLQRRELAVDVGQGRRRTPLRGQLPQVRHRARVLPWCDEQRVLERPGEHARPRRDETTSVLRCVLRYRYVAQHQCVR